METRLGSILRTGAELVGSSTVWGMGLWATRGCDGDCHGISTVGIPRINGSTETTCPAKLKVVFGISQVKIMAK